MSKPGYLIKRGLDPGVLPILFGVTGMLISAFADLIGVGQPGFGIAQLSGLVIGGLMAATGLVRALFPDTLILVRLLAGIYVSGILYVGLRPNPFKCIQDKILLDVSSFYWHDLAINTMGFIPLGYLFMLSWPNRKRSRRTDLFKQAIVVAGVGGLISLFLEFCQYFFVPGRVSNLLDFVANTLGILVGIALYIFTEQEKILDAKIKGLRKPIGTS